MKRIIRWAIIILGLGLCGLAVFGFLWFRQYQALIDDEPDVVLADFFDRWTR